MKNEECSYLADEECGVSPKRHMVYFDHGHFGNNPVAVDTVSLVGELRKWWAQICEENGILNPDDEKLHSVDYYLMELAKNALEYAGNKGQIEVIFGKGKITVVVIDWGPGFQDPNDDILHGASGHGLSQVKDYADEFIIETNGLKFRKMPGNERLAQSRDTDMRQGSRITFIKNLRMADSLQSSKKYDGPDPER